MERHELTRNDKCHCGSGRKYKNCHLDEDKKAGKRVYSSIVEPLRTRVDLDKATLAFVEAAKDVFGIRYDAGQGRGIVAGPVTDERVRMLYRDLPLYFPHSSRFEGLCRDPSGTPYCGLYHGSQNLNSIATYIARYSLYTERIIVPNPFCDLMLYHLDSSPVDQPRAWKQVALNQTLFLVSLEPWIREGLVSVLPPVRWFDKDFHDRELVPLSQRHLDALDERTRNLLAIGGVIEMAKQIPPDGIDSFLRLTFGHDLPVDAVAAVRELSELEYRKNPIRYRWEGPPETMTSVMKIGPGNSLEAALYTAEICDAYLLLGEELYKTQYDASVEAGVIPRDDGLQGLSRAFRELQFNFLNGVTMDFALSVRKDGRLTSLRTFLSRLWSEVQERDLENRRVLYATYRDEIEDQYSRYKQEWKEIDKSLLKRAGTVLVGGAVAVLSGEIVMKVAAGGAVVQAIRELVASREKKKATSRNPLAVFLDLERAHRKR